MKFMLNIFVIYEYNSCPTYLNYSPLTFPKIHLTFMYRKIEIKNGPKGPNYTWHESLIYLIYQEYSNTQGVKGLNFSVIRCDFVRYPKSCKVSTYPERWNPNWI